MCLAIPSKIVKIEDNVATIDVDGVQREASLLLIENPEIGDYVIVHAGFEKTGSLPGDIITVYSVIPSKCEF